MSKKSQIFAHARWWSVSIFFPVSFLSVKKDKIGGHSIHWIYWFY